MSRAYRVRWVRGARTVKARDELQLQLGLLPILSEADMRALLREELGWDKDASRVGDAEVRLASDGKSVSIKLAVQRDVTARGETRKEVDAALDASAQRAEARLTDELGAELARIEPEVRAQVDAAVQRTYVRALQKKAASLGTIESTSETTAADGTRELVIKVRTP